MKVIQNLPQLEQPSGDPYRVKQKDEDEDYIPSLGETLATFLQAIPPGQGQLGIIDYGRAYEVARICKKADGVIELDDDQYKWMMDILFSDDWGAKVHKDVKGPWGPSAFGLWAVAAHKALTQLRITEQEE